MGTVAVIGEETLVRGYALAGALVLAADDAEAVRAAWRDLPGDVAVVILTEAAAQADPERAAGTWPLVAVMR
jgi:vacuolar-type H+-ATPase subunit F/Vma7